MKSLFTLKVQSYSDKAQCFFSNPKDIFFLLLVPFNSFSFDRKKQKVVESKTHPLEARADDNLKEKLKTKFSCKKFQCELSFSDELVEKSAM